MEMIRTELPPKMEIFRRTFRDFMVRLAGRALEWEKAAIVDRSVWFEAGLPKNYARAA